MQFNERFSLGFGLRFCLRLTLALAQSSGSPSLNIYYKNLSTILYLPLKMIQAFFNGPYRPDRKPKFQQLLWQQLRWRWDLGQGSLSLGSSSGSGSCLRCRASRARDCSIWIACGTQDTQGLRSQCCQRL